MQTVLCKRPPTASNNMYRGRKLLHDARCKSYRFVLGRRLHLPRRATLERVPTDWYFLFSACGVDILPPRPPPPQHSHPCLSPTYTRSVFEGIYSNFCVHPSGGRLRIATNYSSVFVFVFSRFSDQLLLRKPFLRKRVIRKRVFLTHKIEFVVVIKKKVLDHFFSDQESALVP